MITVEMLESDYSWQQAFSYAEGFGIPDVWVVLNAVEGENDGDDWIIWGLLKNGKFFYLKAGCDYTGWDCQASGSLYTADTYAELIRMGMDENARQRFGIANPEGAI